MNNEYKEAIMAALKSQLDFLQTEITESYGVDSEIFKKKYYEKSRLEVATLLLSTVLENLDYNTDDYSVDTDY
jgi:hypothetical protein